MRRLALLALVLTLAAGGCGGGGAKVQDAPMGEEGDDPGAPPREAPVKFPPYPKEQDLLRFEMHPRTAFEYFVDGSSISIVDGGIVRFAVVLRTASAVNVSYEGYRCASRERRTYGRANRDGTWIAAKDSGWVSVGPREVSGFRHELYWHYLCPGKRPISSVREGIDALRFGGHPDARPEGTMAGSE
jgi:hypothetical protein